MELSPKTCALHTPDESLAEACPGLGRRLLRDRVLLGAFLFGILLLSYQLIVTLVHPPWSSPATDWLRAALAWPELTIMLLASRWASQTERPEARVWWMLSVAFFFYAVARTLWTVDDQIMYPNHAPFPSFPDPFFMLQYPFFFLAVILIPSGRPWGSRVKLILDGVLVMGSITALSWYCLLAPLYLQNHVSPLGRFINLYYPTADLVVLFGLTLTLIYYQCKIERIVMALLIVGIVCLVTADSWVAWLIATFRFISGTPPDLFWIAFYLLVPLAGLVWLRLPQDQPIQQEEQQLNQSQSALRWQDLKEVLRFLFPFVAALLTSAIIAVRAILAPIQPMSPMAPILVIVSLAVLVLVRQGITLMETAQAQRERALAQTNELAVRQANRQMETFLGIASHELKTPLNSLILSLQLLQRRAQREARPLGEPANTEGSQFLNSQDALALTLQQAGRLARLINDLLDTSRIQAGQLEMTFLFTDLAALLLMVEVEQRQAFPERAISLTLPDQAAPVWGDAERLRQVVTNYLTNALKYSGEGRPVEVGLQVEQAQVRVWVRDQGPGIPPEEHAHIWDRFHRVPGVEVQNGSGIGLGLGLHISKTIIERHHGQVGLESTPGQGATFWFTLPLVGMFQKPGSEDPHPKA